MDKYIFDFEVFAHDWIVVFKNKDTKEYFVFHNDNDGVFAFMEQEPLLAGFNNKHYDQFILKAVLCGFTPEQVKDVNDFIILQGQQGWDHPVLQQYRVFFNQYDLMDDCQQGLSLKAIEAHLGMDIRETTVSFDIDRPLNQEEIDQVVFYCKHDVDATDKLDDIRAGYLRTKVNLGRRAGISEVKALYSTNAKLTAIMLRAQRKEWNDGRNYQYPPNLDISVVPKEILNFFEMIHDMSIPDDVLFKKKLNILIAGFPCTFAWGGVHGSLKSYHSKSSKKRIIQNRDVSSLYPSLIEIYKYLSRNVPDPQLFYDIRADRIAAKHSGDKQAAKDLKLPLNTVSGAQENRFNDLYDPLPTRSMRISGQLFLTMLVMNLIKSCQTIKLLNFNTDGVMYEIDVSELGVVDEVCHRWESITGFELETDDISEVWIKDVNNLLFTKRDGSVKKVGGYLNYGISEKGAWNINNNHIIVKKALSEYLVNGTPVEETIYACDRLLDFQLVAKAGGKYSAAFHQLRGEFVEVQKVNRVYASADWTNGSLYKRHRETGSLEKIAGLPAWCIVDNDNSLTLDAIDREWYVRRAKRYVRDFLGEKTPKRNTRQVNALEKQVMNLLEV